jgi:hypothetical protein
LNKSTSQDQFLNKPKYGSSFNLNILGFLTTLGLRGLC